MHLPIWSSLPNEHYRVAVKWLMFDEQQRLLFLQEDDQGWSLPGWWLHHGEDAVCGLQREIQEETWCPNMIYPQPIATRQKKHHNGVFYFFVWYAIHIDLQHIVPTKECIQYQFFSHTELLEQKVGPEYIRKEFELLLWRYHKTIRV